mmetsp:Transcript_28023/g.79197  ORF Transcript_28023/g.79197 Transcript_28023/m.79197 type:complete len:233 (+) Transcript_28023:1631-2329(+)
MSWPCLAPSGPRSASWCCSTARWATSSGPTRSPSSSTRSARASWVNGSAHRSCTAWSPTCAGPWRSSLSSSATSTTASRRPRHPQWLPSRSAAGCSRRCPAASCTFSSCSGSWSTNSACPSSSLATSPSPTSRAASPIGMCCRRSYGAQQGPWTCAFSSCRRRRFCRFSSWPWSSLVASARRGARATAASPTSAASRSAFPGSCPCWWSWSTPSPSSSRLRRSRRGARGSRH